MTNLSAVTAWGEQALGHCSARGSLGWWSSGIPSQWRIRNLLGAEHPFHGHAQDMLHLLTALLRGWLLSMWVLFFCDSIQALLAIDHSTPELGAGLWLLPGSRAHALGSLHKRCSGIVRLNNRHEFYRNKANIEACCFLFSRLLDFSWIAQQLWRDEDTFPCCPSLPLPSVCSRNKDPGAPWVVFNWTERRWSHT